VKKEKKKRSRQIQIGIFFQKVATKLFSVFHTGHLFVIFDIHFYPWGRRLSVVLLILVASEIDKNTFWRSLGKRGQQERLPLFSFSIGQSDIAASKRVVNYLCAVSVLLLLLRRGGANGEGAPRFGADVCLIMAAISRAERSDAVVQTANAILDEMTQPIASSEKKKKKKRELLLFIPETDVLVRRYFGKPSIA
jgi:hypothetical protein